MLRYVAVQGVLADLRVHAAVPRPISARFQAATTFRACRPFLAANDVPVQQSDYFVNVETAHSCLPVFQRLAASGANT